MVEKRSVPVYFTGNGGQSHHDMAVEDSKKLEQVLEAGENSKTYKFTDQRTKSKVLLVLDKLFVMEVGEKKKS